MVGSLGLGAFQHMKAGSLHYIMRADLTLGYSAGSDTESFYLGMICGWCCFSIQIALHPVLYSQRIKDL